MSNGYYELLKGAINRDKRDEWLMINIYKTIIKDLNFDNIIKEVVYVNSLPQNAAGEYTNHEIRLNRNSFNNKNDIWEYKKELKVFFHELRHVKQFKFLDDNQKFENYKFTNTNINNKDFIKYHALKVFDTIYDADKNLYKKLHDYFPLEHSADIYGYIDSVNFLKTFANQNYPRDYDKNVGHFTLHGYTKGENELIAPVERVLNDYIDPNVCDLLLNPSALSTKEKMILGLKIQKNEYVKMKQSLDSIIESSKRI